MGTRLKQTQSTSEMSSLFLAWKTQKQWRLRVSREHRRQDRLLNRKARDEQDVYRTAVGRLLYICQERADIMYSVKETARKIICPTESDGMNVKRVVRYLKGAPSAKCLIEIVTLPKFVNVFTDSDWAGQPTTYKSTSGGVVQWRNAALTAWSRTRQTASLNSAEAEH